jgi:hypothetical protein
MKFLVPVHTNRHHKYLIFCVTLIISFLLTDIIKGLPTDTINVFLVVQAQLVWITYYMQSYYCDILDLKKDS